MKSVIVFYSYSGNTYAVAKILAEYLEKNSEVELRKLVAKDEAQTFLGQCKRAFFKKKALLAQVSFDLSKADIFCLGTPVWAFGPAPAINAFIEQCSEIKETTMVVLFTTYGSGAGNERCLNIMQDSLRKKGAKNFKRFSIQEAKVKDKEFVLSQIKRVLE
ncbi:MAG: NAD(P)H-dependent oxidoreductase [Candidatus Omnitrophica bacterium]|nr:NAD(P)H-dependent oxidoreductase [Candidatus Omnitrophota bacterium]